MAHNIFKWEAGRQGGGYKKLKLISCMRFDCYLIKFESGFKLPIHVDKVDGKLHYRLNILIYGEDAYQGAYLNRGWRWVLFRADQPHGTALLTHKRLLLSFGWARSRNDNIN